MAAASVRVVVRIEFGPERMNQTPEEVVYSILEYATDSVSDHEMGSWLRRSSCAGYGTSACAQCTLSG